MMLRMDNVKVRSVLAYILLFDFTDDDSTHFKSWQNVNMDDLHILNLIMFQHCKVVEKSTDNFALRDFVRTLREMSNFFSDNLSLREFELAASFPIEPHLKVNTIQLQLSLNIFFTKFW